MSKKCKWLFKTRIAQRKKNFPIELNILFIQKCEEKKYKEIGRNIYFCSMEYVFREIICILSIFSFQYVLRYLPANKLRLIVEKKSQRKKVLCLFTPSEKYLSEYSFTNNVFA